MLTLDKVYQASYVLKDIARRTNLIRANKLFNDDLVFLKTENLQMTGSFKLRGAYFKISQLSDKQKKVGIVACSAGNHAQGVALASMKFGAKSIVCMPDGAPISKVEATKSLGANVMLVPGAYDDAYNKALDLVKETNATFIHPFNDYEVIAGQGTIALEILDQIDDVDQIVVPIGGGGLISGIAFVIKSLKPNIKVYGVQAENARSMLYSLEAKEPKAINTVNTFADGIAVKCPGNITFDMVSKYVDSVVTVTEDEIATAILSLIEQQKLIAEGAGAVSVAAIMFGKIPIKNKKTVCIVSGGNIDVNILSRVITRGLIFTGRTTTLKIALEDKPGQLEGVSRIISKCGGNVVSVYYEQSDKNMAITSCFLTIGVETRNFNHIDEIKNALKDAGFKI